MIAATLAFLLAALLPRASVTEIPETVRTEKAITVTAAHERLIESRGRRVFFRLRGTIIASQVGGCAAFVLLDETQATYVFCSSDDKWTLGDEVEVICTAMQPKYENPVLYSESLELTVLRHGQVPAPVRANPVDLVGHRSDFRIVELEGVVTDAFPDDLCPRWTILMLEYADARTMVWIEKASFDGCPPESLLDAEVRVTGIVHPGICNFRRSPGPWLLTLNPNTFEVTRPPPDSPFDSRLPAPHRQVRSGTVVASWRESNCLLVDAQDDRRLRVQLAGNAPRPSTGDRVTVAGFVRANEFSTRLANALLKIDEAGASPTESPVEVSAEKIVLGKSGCRQFNAAFNERIVRLQGIVRDRRAIGTPDAELTLVDGSATFSALIGAATEAPAPGSRVAVTGVCLFNDVPAPGSDIVRIDSFTIALRSPDDLVVLRTPPWWTSRRLLFVIVVLLLALGGALAWNTILRRLVARRSAALLHESLRTLRANLRTQERTNLAVELHDSLAQELTAVSLELDTSLKMSATAPDALQEHLRRAARILKSSRDELRNCLWDLRNNALEVRTMDEAIRLTLAPHVAGVAVDSRFDVPRTRLPDDTVHTILRIVRELSLNGIRHGGATHLRIDGRVRDGRLEIRVADDGRGFDPATARGFAEGHFGLLGIRERLAELDGTLTLDSRPGAGCHATVSLPMPPDKNKREPEKGKDAT